MRARGILHFGKGDDDDDEMCDVGNNNEKDDNALCFTGLMHYEEIAECWIQRISRDGYNS